MSVEVWVGSVSVERWGRASGMVVPLGDRGEAGGFIVVYGPNESGKTSFATALAWLIAGAGTQGVLQRFGKPDEVLAAGFRGHLDGEPLRANVQVKVTGGGAGTSAVKQEKFQAALSGGSLSGDSVGSLSRDEFRRRLAVGDFAGYRNLHWVEALEVAEGEGTTERLAVKATFGGINPDAEAEKLETEGRARIGKSKVKPGTAWNLLRESEQLRSQIARLGGEWRRLAEAEEELKQISSELAAAQERRTELSKKDKSTQIALEVVEGGLRKRRGQARRALREAPEPSPEKRRIHEQAPQLSSAAAKLEVAEEDLRRSKAEHRSAEGRVHADWRSLISEAPIDKSSLAEVRQASVNLAVRRSEAERADDALNSAKDDFLELVKRLQLQEDHWHDTKCDRQSTIHVVQSVIDNACTVTASQKA